MTVMEFLRLLQGSHSIDFYEGSEFICSTRSGCPGVNPYVNRTISSMDFDCWGRNGSLKITIEKEAE